MAAWHGVFVACGAKHMLLKADERTHVHGVQDKGYKPLTQISQAGK